jgi:hypothetical protein
MQAHAGDSIAKLIVTATYKMMSNADESLKTAAPSLRWPEQIRKPTVA